MSVCSSSSLAVRRLVMGVVGMLVAVAAAALPAQPSYAGPTPGSAEAIGSVPFTSRAPGLWDPQPAAKDADNVKLAADCNGGSPIYRVRWFSYKPTSASTIVARGELNDVSTNDRFAQPVGVAILNSAKAVIDCNVVGGQNAGLNQSVAVAGPVQVAANSTVYVVQFVRVPGGPCSELGCDDAEENLYVRPAGTYPIADDWRNATPITSSPSKNKVDTTQSTQGSDDLALLGCGVSLAVSRTVWWTLTPTNSGPIDASVDVDGYNLGYAEVTASGLKPLGNTCEGTVPTLEKGKTYVIVAGLIQFEQTDEAVSGEPITLSVNSAPALGKPDLVVTKVVASPVAPKAGDPVTFRATIKNQGTAPTGNGVVHGVGFRVDGASPPKTWSDTFNASLAPGQSVTVTANGGLTGATWSAPAGAHTVLATVDDVNRIPGELSEANNTKSLPLSVAAGPARPDLVVTGVSWTPPNPAAGNAVTFKATVQNQGTAATPAGVILGAAFKVDGVAVNWSDNTKASLAPKASTILTATGGPSKRATWTATAGQHAITATVDDVNRITTESDEGNNRLVVALNVGAAASRPDLVVTGVSWTPTSPAAGASVRFTATVRNDGNRSTPAGKIVGVSFRPNAQTAGATFSDSFAGPLHPGQTLTLTANGGGATGTPKGTWKAPAGSTPVVAIVDDINRVPEANEANNQLRTVVTTG